MSDEPLEVLCFGEALIDFFPPATGIPLNECNVFHRHLGGAPANVAVGLSRLGRRVGLMTLVGADAFGDFVRARLQAAGIDTSTLGTHSTAKTGITFVAVREDGERSFLFFRHPSADQLISTADVDLEKVARAQIFHFGSSTLAHESAREATLAALEMALRAGRVVSMDPNWRAHLWDRPREATELIRQVAARAHVVKLSADELEPLLGVRDPQQGAERLLQLGCRLGLVTGGASGCTFASAKGSGHVPADRVRVVDTTGAGDGFVAGLWSVLAPLVARPETLSALSTAQIGDACREGNRVGAQVVGAIGATSAIATRGPLEPAAPDPRLRLELLHGALAAVVDQLCTAEHAAMPGAGQPSSSEFEEVERLLGEAADLRNRLRNRLRGGLAWPEAK
jgi:fructokinase